MKYGLVAELVVCTCLLSSDDVGSNPTGTTKIFVMGKIKVTDYKGYIIEHHPLFRTVIMKDGTSKSCRSLKDAKTFIDLLIENNDDPDKVWEINKDI